MKSRKPSLCTPATVWSVSLLAPMLLGCLLLFAACPASDEPASAEDLARRVGVENKLGEEVAERVTSAVPRTAVRTELALLRGAILTHTRVNGDPPSTLGELDPALRLSFPDEYDYDASTGEVRSRTYPDL